MIESAERYLSASGRSMRRSAIREILKVIQRPGMISFAGGLPAPETFPVNDLKQIAFEILEENGASALQYGTTEGDHGLRGLLAGRHRDLGMKVSLENLMITTGSQQALDLISRSFINRDDHILCGLPSYLGAINSFLSYGGKLSGIPMDDSGMNPSALEETLNSLRKVGKQVKFIYLVPDFQNPSGITMTEQRRKEIIDLAIKYDLLIIEDSPYRDIRFEGETQRTIYELDSSGRVIMLSTFSKILAPGLRVGWVVSNPVLLERLIMAKQTSDLCTSPFAQKIIARYIEKGLLEINIEKTVSLYRQRRDHIISCLGKYMPDGVQWTSPSGGIFLFVTLPGNVDSDKLLIRAIEKNVAFVAGSAFFCNDSGHNTMRINFSYSGATDTDEGIKRLSGVIREEMGLPVS